MLEQALGSVLAQRGVELEVIVVDEASSDDTPDLLSRVGDERLAVIRNETPSGPAPARNAGIERAAGEWVAFLDDDDLWAPENLRRQLSAAKPDDSLSYGGRVEVDGEMTVMGVKPAPDPSELDRGLFKANLLGPPSCVMIRTDLLAQIGGFDQSLAVFADWDLWIRAAAAGGASACSDPLVAYRRHGDNMMVTRSPEMLDEFNLLRAKHRGEAQRRGVDFGANWLTRWTASRDMAAGRRLPAARGYLREAAADRSVRDVLRAVAALGGSRFARWSRSAFARTVNRPGWLEPYA